MSEKKTAKKDMNKDEQELGAADEVAEMEKKFAASSRHLERLAAASFAENNIVRSEPVQKGNSGSRQEQHVEDEDTEIDLLELFGEFKKHIVAIIVAAVICGGLTGAYFKFLVPAQYESTSSLYVLSKETTLTSLADLQIGAQLTNDYKTIVTSRTVLEQVIENLGLDTDYESLNKKITIENPESTRILQISVKDEDPEMARTLTDEVASVSSDFIADIMEMIPPKFIEHGSLPTEKCYPSVTKYAIIAALVGMLVVCGIITVDYLLNDTVKTSEDVKKYLDLPVLATVVYSEGLDDKKEEAKFTTFRGMSGSIWKRMKNMGKNWDGKEKTR